MAYCKSAAVTVNEGAWADATAYSVGDGVTFYDLDAITGEGIRFVCIQAHTSEAGVIEPTLDAADAYWRPAHATTALQWFNAFLALLKSEDFMGAGNAWTEAYRYDARTHASSYISQFTQPLKRLGVVLRSPDVGEIDGRYYSFVFHYPSNAIETRQMMLGASLTFAAPPSGGGTVHTYAGAWASGTSYAAGDVVLRGTSPGPSHSICIQAHTAAAGNQPGTTPGLAYWHDFTLAALPITSPIATENHYHNERSFDCWTYNASHVGERHGPLFKLWDGGTGDIPFCIVANAGRAMWVCQSDTFWTFGHSGTLLRFGTPAENPAPIFLLGNSVWQASQNSFPDFHKAYSDASLMNYPLAARIQSAENNGVVGYRGLGMTRSLQWRFIEQSMTSTNHRWAKPWRCTPFNHADANWLNQNPAGDHSLHDALMLFTEEGFDRGFHGSLDGVYWLPHQGQASGNVVTAGGVDHLVVENVYRGASGGFMALKLA